MAAEKIHFFACSVSFEIGSHYVIQTGLGFTKLPRLPEFMVMLLPHPVSGRILPGMH